MWRLLTFTGPFSKRWSGIVPSNLRSGTFHWVPRREAWFCFERTVNARKGLIDLAFIVLVTPLQRPPSPCSAVGTKQGWAWGELGQPTRKGSPAAGCRQEQLWWKLRSPCSLPKQTPPWLLIPPQSGQGYKKCRAMWSVLAPGCVRI